MRHLQPRRSVDLGTEEGREAVFSTLLELMNAMCRCSPRRSLERVVRAASLSMVRHSTREGDFYMYYVGRVELQGSLAEEGFANRWMPRHTLETMLEERDSRLAHSAEMILKELPGPGRQPNPGRRKRYRVCESDSAGTGEVEPAASAKGEDRRDPSPKSGRHHPRKRGKAGSGPSDHQGGALRFTIEGEADTIAKQEFLLQACKLLCKGVQSSFGRCGSRAPSLERLETSGRGSKLSRGAGPKEHGFSRATLWKNILAAEAELWSGVLTTMAELPPVFLRCRQHGSLTGPTCQQGSLLPLRSWR